MATVRRPLSNITTSGIIMSGLRIVMDRSFITSSRITVIPQMVALVLGSAMARLPIMPFLIISSILEVVRSNPVTAVSITILLKTIIPIMVIMGLLAA